VRSFCGAAFSRRLPTPARFSSRERTARRSYKPTSGPWPALTTAKEQEPCPFVNLSLSRQCVCQLPDTTVDLVVVGDWLLERVADLFGWFITVSGAFVAWVVLRVHTLGARISMLEQTVENLPASLAELKQMLKEQNKEASASREKMYKHIDAVRRELKKDIQDGDRGKKRTRLDDFEEDDQ
jgi:uncharacterized coiled-coil protein SlyX